MKPEEIISLLSQAEEFKPVVKKLIDTCESYKEQVSDFVDMVMYGIAQKKIDIFNYFIENGFSREEALQLTLQTTSFLNHIANNNYTRSK